MSFYTKKNWFLGILQFFLLIAIGCSFNNQSSIKEEINVQIDLNVNCYIPDTYIEKIIDINDVPITIEQIEKKTYEEESNIYNYVFIISIITLLIFVIYHIYNINKNIKNKKAHLK